MSTKSIPFIGKSGKFRRDVWLWWGQLFVCLYRPSTSGEKYSGNNKL